jgi:hypothetical protein
MDGGQVGRHYAPVEAIEDPRKPDADGPFHPEARIRRLDPLADQLLLLVPVVGIAGGVIAFGDPLTPQVLIGASLTIVGVGVITVRRP